MKSLSRSLLLLVPVALLLLAAQAAFAEEHAFVGNKNCKKCHIKEYKSWAETSMAKAFDILKPGERAEAKTAAGLDPDKDYTADASCLVCHTTGHGKEGGFVDIESTPELAGVGCETCHGAGGTYTQDHLMSLKNKNYKRSEVVAAGMVEKVGEEQCVSCHAKEHASGAKNPTAGDDYAFDFDQQMAVEGAHHAKYPLKYDHDG